MEFHVRILPLEGNVRMQPLPSLTTCIVISAPSTSHPSCLGAASDRGYNSMTLEEAKTFSEIIDTEHRESKDKESKFRRDLKNVLSFSFRRKNKKSESEILEESKGKYRVVVHSTIRFSRFS